MGVGIKVHRESAGLGFAPLERGKRQHHDDYQEYGRFWGIGIKSLPQLLQVTSQPVAGEEEYFTPHKEVPGCH